MLKGRPVLIPARDTVRSPGETDNHPLSTHQHLRRRCTTSDPSGGNPAGVVLDAAATTDAAMPPRVAYAGAWHPILATASRERLAALDYDFDALASLMAARDWRTTELVWRESPTVVHARNPFPPGGIVEDPATGAAAAALGGYLRHLRLVDAPATVTIHQGDDMGRPSLLTVNIPAGPDTAIAITGAAVTPVRLS
jgi:predicted PhzF superfamily epimerase YddE/YHI9